MTNEITKASLEQWKELYDYAVKIKEFFPWKNFFDGDLITIIPEDKKKTTVCNILGHSHEFYGIAAYIGDRKIDNFYNMFVSEEIPNTQKMRYNNCIMCNFGDRGELTHEEYEVVKSLGLTFRGHNNWIYFRVYETGFGPYTPDSEQVSMMTEVLKQLNCALVEYYNGLKVDFEKGHTLMRRYDKKSGQWINSSEEKYVPSISYEIPALEDEVLIQRLKNQERNDEIIEIDLPIIPTTIRDSSWDKPIMPRMCMLASENDGIILAQQMIEPGNDNISVQIIIGTFINYIMQCGRPIKVKVRDSYIKSYIYDLCSKINVEIEETQNLVVINDCIETFVSRRED